MRSFLLTRGENNSEFSPNERVSMWFLELLNNFHCVEHFEYDYIRWVLKLLWFYFFSRLLWSCAVAEKVTSISKVIDIYSVVYPDRRCKSVVEAEREHQPFHKWADKFPVEANKHNADGNGPVLTFPPLIPPTLRRLGSARTWVESRCESVAKSRQIWSGTPG